MRLDTGHSRQQQHLPFPLTKSPSANGAAAAAGRGMQTHATFPHSEQHKQQQQLPQHQQPFPLFAAGRASTGPFALPLFDAPVDTAATATMEDGMGFGVPFKQVDALSALPSGDNSGLARQALPKLPHMSRLAACSGTVLAGVFSIATYNPPRGEQDLRQPPVNEDRDDDESSRDDLSLSSVYPFDDDTE